MCKDQELKCSKMKEKNPNFKIWKERIGPDGPISFPHTPLKSVQFL